MIAGLIGAPSSAGGHWAGMEKAPAFLRLAGLPEGLSAGGAKVVDHGDLPQLRWRPDPASPRAQNVALVSDYLKLVARRVEDSLSAGEWPIVVGGECTVTIGAVVGFLRKYEDFGLMYLDGHVDLNTPESSRSGILDSMGMAHMFGQEGTLKELSHLGSRFPMLDPAKVVYFGYNERKMNDIEVDQLKRHGSPAYPMRLPEGSVRALAEEALSVLESRTAAFAVHFDVDVIRFSDFPIANVPVHHEGLSFDQAMECVEVFASSPRCVGAVITEVNPDHATEELGRRFAAATARALTARIVSTTA